MKRLYVSSILVITVLTLSGCSLPTSPTPDLSLTNFPTPLPTLPILVTPLPAQPTSPQPTQAPPAALPTQAAPAPTSAPSSPIPTPAANSTLQVAPAQRISFDAGATNSDVSGSLSTGGQKWFVIGALKGQTMLLSLSSPASDVYLAVTDASGSALASASQRLTSWTGMLPSNGDYLVEVFTPGDGANFDLSVTIPQRIVFDQGAVSATVSGSVGKNRINNYLARANGGQTMTVTLSSATAGAALTIYGLQDGEPLLRSASGQASWSGKLPATQDYMIDVVAGSAALDYSLKVTIK